MSLLDTIEEHHEKFDEYIGELRIDLVRDFLYKYCRYGEAHYNYYEDASNGWDPSRYILVTGENVDKRAFPKKCRIQCSQAGLLRDCNPRIFAVDNNYPILIEGWDEPELPPYVEFAFPRVSYAPEFSQANAANVVYSCHKSIVEGSICLLNCHPDLLKNSELVRLGINVIRLSYVGA